ncbi:hypothetical protein RF11_14407 [Thelohanellus kitauei]|uniref:Uncharacterized protein n=1 Tax=Thelohanellus kitauei TaxID=669202 RepID=A0A0C2NDN8_THEKT|nr:hypothetical protein RF11_14407 [Thelohanellus kitauei]
MLRKRRFNELENCFNADATSSGASGPFVNSKRMKFDVSFTGDIHVAQNGVKRKFVDFPDEKPPKSVCRNITNENICSEITLNESKGEPVLKFNSIYTLPPLINPSQEFLNDQAIYQCMAQSKNWALVPFQTTENRSLSQDEDDQMRGDNSYS